MSLYSLHYEGAGLSGSATWCAVNAVVKRGNRRAYSVANEGIATALAMAVGAPVPPGTYIRTPTGIAFARFYFGAIDHGQPQPSSPFDLGQLQPEHADAAACILVLDQWLLVDDRHLRNLALSSGRLIAFDFDGALFGVNPHSAIVARTDCFVPHVLRRVVQPTLVQEWIWRVEGLSDGVLAGAVDDAARCGVIDAADARDALTFLRTRQQKLADLVARQLAGA